MLKETLGNGRGGLLGVEAEALLDDVVDEALGQVPGRPGHDKHQDQHEPGDGLVRQDFLYLAVRNHGHSLPDGRTV